MIGHKKVDNVRTVNRTYTVVTHGFENYSVVNIYSGRMVMQNIAFYGCATNLIHQLNHGVVDEDRVV